MRPKGVIPPHVTPFMEDGSLDLRSLERLVTFWLDAGVHALATCASNGEGPLLSDDERKKVLRFVVDLVGGQVPVIAGVSSPSTAGALRQIEDVENSGADAILLTPPYYFKPSERELLEHYRFLLRETGLPVILYNVPKFVGYNLPLDIIVKLAQEFDNVVGLKESSGLLWRISELIRLVGDKVSVLAGTGDMLLPTLMLGGRGGIVGVAIFAPELAVDLYNSFRSGHLERAAKLQLVLTMLNEVVVKGLNQLSAAKEALRLRGLPAGFPRRPSLPLTAEEREMVRKALEDAGLLSGQ
ncbi:MAG: dihydrodipicolinate synthase family protein [Candidatus Korarchaeota archaeon]|nr:dihydrodipicolinate synthase family protein [Candidatus Korarchaeota archaeon]